MKFSLNKLSDIQKYSDVLTKRITNVKRDYAYTLWNNLYQETPKRTGAAAASWNVSLDTPNYSFDPNKTSNSFSLTITNIDSKVFLATGCPYMNRLNYGWSEQAPANFIERCITISNQELPQIINKYKGN